MTGSTFFRFTTNRLVLYVLASFFGLSATSCKSTRMQGRSGSRQPVVAEAPQKKVEKPRVVSEKEEKPKRDVELKTKVGRAECLDCDEIGRPQTTPPKSKSPVVGSAVISGFTKALSGISIGNLIPKIKKVDSKNCKVDIETDEVTYHRTAAALASHVYRGTLGYRDLFRSYDGFCHKWRAGRIKIDEVIGAAFAKGHIDPSKYDCSYRDSVEFMLNRDC